MPDTIETRILKDINRHLAHIDEAAGMTDKLTPSEAAALNKNAGEIIGNFSSLISAETKDLINSGNKQLIEAFGNLKGFDTEVQADLLDDVVDELKTNNRFASKAEHNDFLEEAEREEDLKINRRTNDLLEDLNDKEDDAASASASAESGGGMGIGGFLSGLLGGAGIKGLLGGIAKFGKKLFFPALLAVAGMEFLRGWAEAGKDSSVMAKFNSGIGRALSDLTFGLISKDFFTNSLESIQGAIGRGWKGFTDRWNEFVYGKISAPDFFANIISDLSLGTLSADQIKLIGQQIEDGMIDVVATIVDAVITGIVAPLMTSLKEQLVDIFTDPVGFFKAQLAAADKKEKEELEARALATKELMDEGVSETSAKGQTFWKDFAKNYLGIGGELGLEIAKKLGAFSETQEEANIVATKKADKKLKEADIEAKKDKARAQRLEAARDAANEDQIKAARAAVSNVGQEGLNEKVVVERVKTEKRNQEEPAGNALQINQNNSISTPVDRQTENDDLINLRRSSYAAEGTW